MLEELLVEKLTALADDEVVLAQRLSEWVAHAPILEEDIAIANLAQDELGHAKLYLELRRELDGSDPDELVFFRDPWSTKTPSWWSFPRGTGPSPWSGSTSLTSTRTSGWRRQGRAPTPLAEAAERILKEERFHLKHSALWVERLGLGTEESHARAQKALEALFPYAKQLFVPLPGRRSFGRRGTCRT